MINFFKTYGMVFLLSMAPVSELRGAIPAGIAMDINPFILLPLCVLGNVLPVPFIILCIRKIFSIMKKWGGIASKIVEYCEHKADKAAKMFYKYELLGLFILVAIPLPGTGAWTGALVAAMLRIRLKTAFPVISLGVLAAGIIMLILSCGVSTIAG